MLIHRIAIYTLDSVMQRLNSWDQIILFGSTCLKANRVVLNKKRKHPSSPCQSNSLQIK